jgi:hypothetical protein
VSLFSRTSNPRKAKDMKVVINKCYGGFSLSEKACKELGLKGPYSHIERNDPRLVEVVELLGKESWGDCAELKVVEIPDDVEYEIEEYDGTEWIAEVHRMWN